jgi:hypothetical protein
VEFVVFELISQLDMVVDLTVDSQEVVVVIRLDRLGTSIQTNDSQTFMAKNGGVSDDITGPVWTTMTNHLGVVESGLLVLVHFGLPESSENSTHVFCKVLGGGKLL